MLSYILGLSLICTETWSALPCVQVYDFVGLTELYYAGSHGMDILGPVRPMSNDHLNCIRSTDKQVIGLDSCLSCTLIFTFNHLFLFKLLFFLGFMTFCSCVHRVKKLTYSSLLVNSYLWSRRWVTFLLHSYSPQYFILAYEVWFFCLHSKNVLIYHAWSGF